MKIFALITGLFKKKNPALAAIPAGEGEEGAAETPAPQLFPSLIPWLLTMAGMSVVAIIIGAAVGLTMISSARDEALNLIASQERASPDATLIALPPIITNLADPATAWVRLQTAIVVDKKSPTKPEVIAAEIADDILGFMKTVTLAQIGGASGLQHLREDLTERAVIRSQGHVRELIIQTLVVQ
jgi:flagellar protein FliL